MTPCAYIEARLRRIRALLARACICKGWHTGAKCQGCTGLMNEGYDPKEDRC